MSKGYSIVLDCIGYLAWGLMGLIFLVAAVLLSPFIFLELLTEPLDESSPNYYRRYL